MLLGLSFELDAGFHPLNARVPNSHEEVIALMDDNLKLSSCWQFSQVWNGRSQCLDLAVSFGCRGLKMLDTSRMDRGDDCWAFMTCGLQEVPAPICWHDNACMHEAWMSNGIGLLLELSLLSSARWCPKLF